ncbi:MAG: DUF2799 domain-containing protein [Pseudomonadota bacterium]
MGCSSIELTQSLYQCQQLDWFELGRSDGVQGRDSMGWKIRKDSCESFQSIHHESYVTGWYTGVDEFCSVPNAFVFGQTGQKYRRICPQKKEAAFLLAYQQGLKIYRFEKENKEISEELRKLNLLTSTSAPQSLPPIIKKMNELETQLELNQALIAELQQEVGTATSVQK